MKLRAGVEGLAVETGRYSRIGKKKKERWQRTCKLCGCGKVEDEEHFLDECVWWEDERKELWERVASVDYGICEVAKGWGREDRVDWMMKGENRRTTEIVLREVSKMLYKREKVGGVEKGKQKDRKIMEEVERIEPPKAPHKDQSEVKINRVLKKGSRIKTRWGFATVVRVISQQKLVVRWKEFDGLFDLDISSSI